MLKDETGAEEDSDDWLNVDAEDFEDVLAQRMGISKDAPPENAHTNAQARGQDASEDRVAHEQASRLRNLAQKVEEFVEGEGDMEGAMFKEFV
jgi:beta-lactamase class A